MSHFAINKTYGVYKVISEDLNYDQFKVKCTICDSEIVLTGSKLFRIIKKCICHQLQNTNIIGKTISSYEVIKVTGDEVNLKCKLCSSETNIDLDQFRRRKVRLCQCVNKRTPSDLTGQVFGRLTVLSKHPTRPRFLLTKCECGIEKIVNRSSLTSGSTRSCGCLQRENKIHLKANRTNSGRKLYYVNAKKGMLTVLESANEYKNGKLVRKVLTKCDCGNITVKPMSYFYNKRIKILNCGCLKSKNTSDAV